MGKAILGNLLSELTDAITNRFDAQQRTFCVRTFYQLNNSYIAVRRWFRGRYVLHNVNKALSTNLIKVWINKFEERGSTENIHPPMPQ